MTIPDGPMDGARPKMVTTTGRGGDYLRWWEFTPARSYDYPTYRQLDAYISLWVTGEASDTEMTAYLSSQDARDLAAALNAWADSCDQERTGIGAP